MKRSFGMIDRALEICGLLYINTQIPYFAHPWEHDTLGRTDGATREIIFGLILKQQDFLTLITISSRSSLRSQIFNNLSNIQTDGATNRISSA